MAEDERIRLDDDFFSTDAPKPPASQQDADEDEAIELDAGHESQQAQPPEAPVETDEDDEPISLVEEGESEASSGGVRAFGAAAAVTKTQKKKQFQRPLNVTGRGATRCRLFHSKIAQAPLEHLEESINEWLDSDEIEVKHVGHVIGTMEGKRPEPNLVVMVWY
ncbi:MAG: hypothetical protein ACOC8F_00615 [Planctomycetota bacterium]